MAAIHGHRGANESRTGGQTRRCQRGQAPPGSVNGGSPAAADADRFCIDPGLAHRWRAGHGLHRAHEKRRRNPLPFRDDVQTVVHTVDKVHVGDSRLPEHHGIAFRTTESGVRRHVLEPYVRLHLDNSPDAAIRTTLAHEKGAQDVPDGVESRRSEDFARERVGRQGNNETRSDGRMNDMMCITTGTIVVRRASAMWDWLTIMS